MSATFLKGLEVVTNREGRERHTPARLLGYLGSSSIRSAPHGTVGCLDTACRHAMHVAHLLVSFTIAPSSTKTRCANGVSERRRRRAEVSLAAKRRSGADVALGSLCVKHLTCLLSYDKKNPFGQAQARAMTVKSGRRYPRSTRGVLCAATRTPTHKLPANMERRGFRLHSLRSLRNQHRPPPASRRSCATFPAIPWSYSAIPWSYMTF